MSLFECEAIYARELTAPEVPRLQGLFEVNPDYFLAINGRKAGPDEAQIEFEELPPAHLGFTRRWVVGMYDRSDELVGFVSVVSDLGGADVWHIPLFLLAKKLHGRGLAGTLYVALESWARQAGAKWMRLGGVEGNGRAERFWLKHGFREVRVRAGVDTGGRVNNVRVLVKLLGEAGIAEYLEAVPRDRPDSTLP